MQRGMVIATLYVSPTGSGNQSGSDWGNAATINKLDKMVKLAGAGGTVLLQADAGSYHVSNSISLNNGGSDGHDVTIKGVTKAGVDQNVVIEGTRPTSWNPANPTGNELIRLADHASHLVFENFTINNVKNAFNATTNVDDITIKGVTANNVERFFENYASSSAKIADVSNLNISNVDVHGFSKGVIRLQYDSHDITIANVHGDSMNEDGANFAIGIHLDGTVHDVLIKDTSMGNITDTTHSYWNGDGFATEWGVARVRFENTSSTGNTDAGYDLKSSATVLVNAYAEDNKKNFRIWADTTIIDSVGKNPHLRGGSGDQLQVQVMTGGHATIIGGKFSDAGGNTSVFQAMGDLTIKGGTQVTHAAGSTLVSGGNAAAVVGLDTVKLANVQAVGSYSHDYVAAAAFGKIGDNLLVEATAGNEAFTGSAVVDAFHFDTRGTIKLGDDAVRSFGTEDRLVTTTKLSDPSGTGYVAADSSDRFTFIGVDGKGSGTVKLFADATSTAVSHLKLVGTVMENGVANYVYGVPNATGDGSAVTKLLDTAFKGVPAKTVTASTAPIVDAAPARTTTAPTAPIMAAPAKIVAVSHVPTGAIQGTAANDTLTGTAAKDIFFFDTAKGAATGNDVINKFGLGDRIVTTSKIADPNHDNKIEFNSSDKLVLPGAGATDSVGTLKIFYAPGTPLSHLDLVTTVVDHNETYYVYASHGDAVAGAGLHFA